MERVILSLGTNKGNKTAYLKNAVKSLNSILSDTIFSSVYNTAPQDYEAQDDFLNMVVIGYYKGEPLSLLAQINEIERLNGRNRNNEIHKGPRTLDIDILFFGNLEFSTPRLTIPHPEIKKRAFVLVPLLELLPDFKEPNTSLFYRDYLNQLSAQRVEKSGYLEYH